MKGHIVVTGCAGFIGSHLTDRLLADGRTVVGIDSFEDYYPRAIKEANLEGARANPAFTLHEAHTLDLAAEAAPGGPDDGGNLVSLLEAIATLGEFAGTEPKLIRWGVEAGDVRDTCADVSRAAEYIGYVPTMHLKAGLAHESAWLEGKSRDTCVRR